MPKKSKIIDEKDRKILIELDRNARQSDSGIAKKVGLSKQVVNYRIQKLIENKIVNNFYTIVNIGNLGLNFYYVFIQFENINKEREKKLLEKLDSLDYVGWLVSGMGRWDAVIGINANSVLSFEKFLNEIINVCGKNLHEYLFTTLVSAEHLSYKFLSEKEISYAIRQSGRIKIGVLDKIDKKILKIISQDARLALTEISDKTKLPLHVVNYHLKNMIKNKIIEGFKPKLDINKLGYQWHLLLIQFQRITEERKREFIEFCKNHKKIYYVTNTIGNYNIMLDVHVENVEEFKEVLLDIKDEFSDIIRLYESLIIFDEYKIDYLPKEVLKYEPGRI